MAWRRPYGALVGSAIVMLAEFMGPPAFVLFVILLFTRAPGPVIAGVAAGYLVVFAPFVVRLSLLGVYVGDHGVRVRRMLGTETVPWADVTGIGRGHATLGPFDLDRDAIVVTATGGRVLRSPIQVGSIEFVMYRWSTHFHLWRRWAFGQILVARAGFDGIVLILRDHLARENPRAAAPPATPAPAPRVPAADAAILARMRERGEIS